MSGIYLVTPPVFDAAELAETLRPVFERVEISCLRLSLASTDEDDWIRAANHLIEPCHAADIALVIGDHHRLVAPLGLDGVHLSGPPGGVRKAREALGRERIVGYFAGASRHDGLTAAEAGADYVSFGPAGDPGALGEGDRADDALFQWWAEMIEVPVIAEGAVTPGDAARLADLADFIVPGPAIWEAPDVAEALLAYRTGA